MCKKGNVLSKDAECSNYLLDFFLNERRLDRVAVNLYKSTGYYVFLKLFNRDSEQVDWDFNQKFTFSVREFQLFCHNIEKIEEMVGTPDVLIDTLLQPD